MFQIDIISFAYGAAAFTIITVFVMFAAIYVFERGGDNDK